MEIFGKFLFIIIALSFVIFGAVRLINPNAFLPKIQQFGKEGKSKSEYKITFPGYSRWLWIVLILVGVAVLWLVLTDFGQPAPVYIPQK